MSFFGVELNAQINRLILEIRLKLSQNKFIPNFRTIYRSLVQYDPQVSGVINLIHFQKVNDVQGQAFNENGIFLKKYQFQAIEKAYKDQSGLVNWFKFLSHLRQPMGPVRRSLVQKIFDSMDTQKQGKLTPQKLMFHFNAGEIDTYKKKVKSQQEIINIFLSMLSIPEGHITREQFISFYDDCNINFHHNDVFNRYVSCQWNYTVQKLELAKEEEIKAASKQFRARLIQKSQGTKDQYLLGKLFEEFELSQNYSIGLHAFDCMMKKLHIEIAPKIVEPLFAKIDANKSEFIEFDEFKKYLANDPYPI